MHVRAYVCMCMCVGVSAGVLSLFDFFVDGHIPILSLFINLFFQKKSPSPFGRQDSEMIQKDPLSKIISLPWV